MDDDIAYWHWLYHHDFGVPDTWFVSAAVALVTRTGIIDDRVSLGIMGPDRGEGLFGE